MSQPALKAVKRQVANCGCSPPGHTENEEQVPNWAHKPRILPVISKLQGFDICFGNNLWSEWQGGKMHPSLEGDSVSVLLERLSHKHL